MELIYAPEPIPVQNKHSVMLCGPTPRSQNVESWRPEAIEYFTALGFDGTLYIPEPRDGKFSHSYEDQISWELHAIEHAGLRMFWVPRDIAGGMPAFTTNTEFGYCIAQYCLRRDFGADWPVIYGRPDAADKCRYLDELYRLCCNQLPHHLLSELCTDVVRRLR